ncbi:BLOC-1- complex subunit 8 [Datura stramonium]|uniref:BLOC-1- complex subunit 8 n=1 Tax=Datura stramonium TaxID=4076 RepID=A0ABS8RKY6_DATST|nr:BLOC-1- complex subunit 8 [Datura stramonium]
MFSDEEHLAFKKMHALSTVNGFVEITESLADMIKLIANEPSAGLFYVQQHTHNAVPNLINLNGKIEEKSRQVTLHTADTEDSIIMVRSMKECGFSIANEMIKDLRHSLAVVSEKQQRSGFISRPSSSFRIGRTISWNPATWGQNTGPEQDGQRNGSYISNVFRSAKEKANSFKLPQMESIESKPAKNEASLPDKDEPSVTCSNDATLAADASSCSSGQQR